VETVVVVGASLAGHSTVAALREQGHDGRIIVLGAEEVAAYDRPPLSKGFLTGRVHAEHLLLDELEADWRLGQAATGLDLDTRTVRLADGTSVAGDLVVVATGARARTLGPPMPGVHTLRSLGDAAALRADLERGGRLVVVGGGFIGCEVAATARGLGLDVVLVEAGPGPLAAPLGTEVSTAVRALHTQHGVVVRCGVGVAGLRGADRVEAVRLADGTELVCDTVVVALGSVANVEWLADSGLDVSAGVRCDERGLAAPGVFAVGDCSAWFDPVLARHQRVEHWTDAFERARVVAATALGSRPHPVGAPYFWSDQYDVRLQFAGRRTPDAALRLEDGDGLLGVWWRDEEPVAVIGLNRPRDVARWRRRLVQPAPTGALA
jgi:NADPH-dependent 2,4-dienoyl-CoA reductase/sulfur reductase-like enzyme